ncbi:MAG: PD40 domain-containing protein [Chitinispirillaceae bacterium]|nr:PD40 domain-containing protein [Chitinispirillaceae bacterium]
MIALRAFTLFCLALAILCGPHTGLLPHDARDEGRAARISPDYSGITLPSNIAPLNFRISESGDRFLVSISSAHGKPIIIACRDGDIRIPEKKWRGLLVNNRGERLTIDVFSRERGKPWRRYTPLINRIAKEPIDPYMTYRSLHFLYNYSSDLRIHERHLESFREKTLLSTRNFYWGCVNCHTPESNDPRQTVLHTRSNAYGSATIIARDGALRKINAKLGYTAWRPGGSHIAFSTSRVRQCFHSTGKNPIDDYDLSSELFVYDVGKETIIDIPELCDEGLIQSWPAWSPDGTFLYFCRGPVLWTDFNEVPPDRFEELKCSLLRAQWNDAANTIGALDTVLSADSAGLSITQPRVSPDGRFILFCMHAYGPYPVTQRTSDLYLLDLETLAYRRLDVSSDESESWHGWSKNGRWIVFSSKRNSGIFTRLYFAHIDSLGFTSKPFVLPQKDPGFYQSYIRCFNVPELAIAAVPYTERKLIDAIRSPKAIQATIPRKRSVPEIKVDPSSEWGAPPVGGGE